MRHFGCCPDKALKTFPFGSFPREGEKIAKNRAGGRLDLRLGCAMESCASPKYFFEKDYRLLMKSYRT
jgi:hypothetical protein